MELIAIDPGVGGGIAYTDKNRVHAFQMPATLGDLQKALEILSQGETVAYIEELPKFAGKMSGSSMGVMFRNYGRIEGILSCLKTRIVHLKPQAWQNALNLGTKATHGKRWKAHLKEKAQNLFPHLDVTLKTADALLILEAAKKLQK